ncbi:hypothetical protein H5395_15725 [Paracoccus sp. MC1854]|uniref:hypothetical protein n=1 Tax=Paracoccus sp. MC1854 TaxID=2760306 RepID=UPI00160182AB|nr:hypothetical protein [Paracoccus sp. MC1854]MBB1492939.1 hypothetical protein [Paracoccus sp. MC1854]
MKIFGTMIACFIGSFPPIAYAQEQTAKIAQVNHALYEINEETPRSLTILAVGKVPTSGWKNAKLVPYAYPVLPDDGILDVDFVADAPNGYVLKIIMDVDAKLTGIIDPHMKGIRVHSSTNSIEILFDHQQMPSAEMSNLKPFNGELPWPFSSGVDLLSIRRPQHNQDAIER